MMRTILIFHQINMKKKWNNRDRQSAFTSTLFVFIKEKIKIFNKNVDKKMNL